MECCRFLPALADPYVPAWPRRGLKSSGPAVPATFLSPLPQVAVPLTSLGLLGCPPPTSVGPYSEDWGV